jgi:CBS domain-containing protein
MEAHQVRRLPVIDGHDLVGMLSQADVVQATPGRAGRTVSEISEPS